MIVFLTKDLMMSSNVSAHAKEHGVPLRTVSDATAAIKKIQSERPHLLIVDLQTPSLNVTELGVALRELSDSLCPLTIAFAQHVNVGLLKEARDAGFDQVLTRGQMNAQVGQIVGEMA